MQRVHIVNLSHRHPVLVIEGKQDSIRACGESRN
jgi:CDGSH-type Zn-finger protein